MGAKLLTIAAIACMPAVALAQTGTSSASTGGTGATAANAQQSEASQATSTGEVAGGATVPQAAVKEQQDPNLIGSPAWWSTHSTADGQPKRS